MTEAIPLRDRVSAPATLEPPSHPEVAVWRPATRADLAAIHTAQRAADLVDHADWLVPLEELEGNLFAGNVDVDRDTIVGFAADGAVAAWGLVWLHPARETRVQSHLDGNVHPGLRGRGIGRVLLDWQLARARQQFAGIELPLPARVHFSALADDAARIRLAESSGLRIARWFTEMERPVAGALPEIELPEGMRLERFAPRWREATRLARNDAFRDHWGSQTTGRERWDSFVGSPQFRDELSWLVVGPGPAPDGGDRVLAFALTTINEEDWVAKGASFGYVDLIGVRREARGRRLAPAVMAAQLRGFAEAGLQLAVLDVDTENPTGALGLYERMGYRAGRREVTLVAEF